MPAATDTKNNGQSTDAGKKKAQSVVVKSIDIGTAAQLGAAVGSVVVGAQGMQESRVQTMQAVKMMGNAESMSDVNNSAKMWGAALKSIMAPIIVTGIAQNCVSNGIASQAIAQQRAAMAVYACNTLLSDTYIEAMTENMSKVIDKVIDDKVESALDDGVVGSTFNGINKGLDSVSEKLESSVTKVTDKMDKVAKYDVMQDLTDLSNKGVHSIVDRMKEHKALGWMGDVTGVILSYTMQGVLNSVASSPFYQNVLSVQSKILQTATLLKNYVAKVQAEIQKIKEIVNQFKQQIYKAAQEFVKQIIAPIKAAVVNAIKGVLTGVAGTIKDAIKGSLKGATSGLKSGLKSGIKSSLGRGDSNSSGESGGEGS